MTTSLPYTPVRLPGARQYPVKCPKGHLVVMLDTPGVTVTRFTCPDRGCGMRVETKS